MITELTKKLSGSMSTQLAAAAVLMLGTLGVAPMLAQDAGGPPPPQQGEGHRNPAEMQQRQLDHMTRALNLTPDQVTQVKAIQLDGRAKAEALHSDSTLAPADKRDKMMAMRKDEEAKVRAVLTPDQQTKFDSMMAHRGEGEGHRRDGQDAPPPPPPPPPSL